MIERILINWLKENGFPNTLPCGNCGSPTKSHVIGSLENGKTGLLSQIPLDEDNVEIGITVYCHTCFEQEHFPCTCDLSEHVEEGRRLKRELDELEPRVLL